MKNKKTCQVMSPLLKIPMAPILFAVTKPPPPQSLCSARPSALAAAAARKAETLMTSARGHPRWLTLTWLCSQAQPLRDSNSETPFPWSFRNDNHPFQLHLAELSTGPTDTFLLTQLLGFILQSVLTEPHLSGNQLHMSINPSSALSPFKQGSDTKKLSVTHTLPISTLMDNLPPSKVLLLCPSSSSSSSSELAPQCLASQPF